MSSKFDDDLKASLILHEGKRHRIYVDSVGKITGGIGRNLSDVGFSDDEIELMYQNDIERAKKACVMLIPNFARLDHVRRIVMIEMAFNLGQTKFAGFVNTLDAVYRGDYERAASQMLKSRWAKQVGQRARTLAQMMRSGKMPE